MGNTMIREWSAGYIIDHWVRVISIVVLTFTGLYIHWPFIAGGPESFIMAWMRFFHFIAAYALILGLVVRVYMAFRSTFDSDWKDFSITENMEKPRTVQAPAMAHMPRHATDRGWGPPR